MILRRVATEDAEHLVFELDALPGQPKAIIKVRATEEGRRMAALLANADFLEAACKEVLGRLDDLAPARHGDLCLARYDTPTTTYPCQCSLLRVRHALDALERLP